ncbi:fatty-acyl-CoA synthase [Flexibacter flexilis DSM 6793]|uniref:Fatty-acyl-CoA synthase n=1 Tax=Flexibacter flexilis DSM 6793 TaxID=927664 RepID=A0A1I1DPJ1_9BACT|nr:AMP-binding protein [Flexibacter flexilis]SFB74958.1 fatty-acyl-CoA synthase [Flexibacter flexilis DSM 6793]
MKTAKTAQRSYVSGASNVPLLGQTIGENLRETVAKFPQRDALICVEQQYRATYAEFWEQVEQVAKAFLALHVRKGDRVGIWSPNRYEWVLVQYATARIGAILVNINPAYRAAELSYALTQSGISVLVSAVAFKDSNYKQMVQEAEEVCPELRKTIFFDENWDEFLQGTSHVSTHDLEAVEATLQFDEPINIQYTSGTTGFPKGATLTHHNILNNGYFIGQRLNYTELDRVCIPVPFYHCFGMVIGNLCCTSHGACMVVPSDSFEAAKTLYAVEKEKCTSLYGVPTMFIAELQHPDFEKYNLTSLRTGVMAGSPCPVEVMKQVQSRMYMREVGICYGMTETSPVSTQTKIGTPLEKQVSTVGTIHDHLEIKIIDPSTGQTMPRGVAGELCTRGYSVMLGYWNNPEATREAIDAGRWMHTGDLATMDEEGYINIVGRIKDLILRGGENIYPREVEEFLHKHEAVADVQVIGVPSEKYGEEVMAWVKLKEGYNLTAEDLQVYCKAHIARYKIPKYWKFVDGFPMTVSGKVRKIAMREESIAELGLEHVAKIKTS